MQENIDRSNFEAIYQRVKSALVARQYEGEEAYQASIENFKRTYSDHDIDIDVLLEKVQESRDDDLRVALPSAISLAVYSIQHPAGGIGADGERFNYPDELIALRESESQSRIVEGLSKRFSPIAGEALKALEAELDSVDLDFSSSSEPKEESLKVLSSAKAAVADAIEAQSAER